jgi:hypothetical protein
MEINPNEQRPVSPVSNKKSPSRLIVIISILIAIPAGAWFLLPLGDHAEKNVVSTAPMPLKKEVHQAAPTRKTSAPQAEEKNKNHPGVNTAPEQKIISPVVQEQEINPQQQCEQLANDLNLFFSHLDNEAYIKEFNLNQSSLQYFSILTTKLLANPPVVTRESDDLYTILTNMAHFFRIIGQQNILLLKGILDRERDKIEDIAAELYKWTIVDQCRGDNFPITASLDKLYEYAGFFLNTMGGRSYLFRRDSRSRLLVNYYAILIIDQTNKEDMNRYGLDIRELIPRLIEEIEATNQLIYKEDYLDNLLDLQEEYQ